MSNYEGYLLDKNNNRVIPNQDFFKRVGALSLNANYLIVHNQWTTIIYPVRDLNNDFLEWSNGKFIIKNLVFIYLMLLMTMELSYKMKLGMFYIK